MAGWGDTSLQISPDEFPDPIVDDRGAVGAGEQSVVLAGGCFWCIEAVYAEVEGVLGLTLGLRRRQRRDGRLRDRLRRHAPATPRPSRSALTRARSATARS